MMSGSSFFFAFTSCRRPHRRHSKPSPSSETKVFAFPPHFSPLGSTTWQKSLLFSLSTPFTACSTRAVDCHEVPFSRRRARLRRAAADPVVFLFRLVGMF